jgi:hypothetical protein
MGDVVSLGARRMLVVETGRLAHSGGYGPVEMRAVDLLDDPFAAGTIVNTPWGAVEIVAVDDAGFVEAVAEARRTRDFRTAEPSRLADRVSDGLDEYLDER